MKKANIVLDNQATGLKIIEKMEYEGVDAFHDALCYSFYPDGIDDDENLDDRFIALWILFLHSVGWTEEEYWEEYKLHPECCPGCGEELDENGDHLEDDLNLTDTKSSESKPN